MVLQKDSPYLDDANELIDLANQMGLIERQIHKSVPNASNCLTPRAVQESHIKRGERVTYQIEDICGMVIALGLGLVVGLTILISELLIVRALIAKKRINSPVKLPTVQQMIPVKIVITRQKIAFSSTRTEISGGP